MRALSFNSLKLIRVFVISTANEFHGYKLGKMIGVRGQNLYAILREMQADGWLDSRIDATIPARPTKYYSINEKGLEAARDVLSKVQVPSLMCSSA